MQLFKIWNKAENRFQNTNRATFWTTIGSAKSVITGIVRWNQRRVRKNSVGYDNFEIVQYDLTETTRIQYDGDQSGRS